MSLLPSSRKFPSASKSVSVWNKRLKTDFKGLFQALSKAAVFGVTGQWEHAARNAIEAVEAIGLLRSPVEAEWLLIHRSLVRAVFELVGEQRRLLSIDKEAATALADHVDLSLESREIRLDSSFFDHPKDFELLSWFKVPLESWLVDVGLDAAQAEAVSRRLPTYFTFALNEEWLRDPAAYDALRTTATPFVNAAAEQQAWQRYDAELQRQADEPMFDEAFGIKSVYVPLRGWYELRDTKDDRTEREELQASPRRRRGQVVDVEEHLSAWLGARNPDDSLRILSGGPGSGKSTLARLFSTRMSAEGHRTIYVPLYLLNLKGDVRTAIADFARDSCGLKADPLDFDDGQDLLLVFDGLDELVMLGRFGLETGRDFIRMLVLELVRLRSARRMVFALVTGRELVVQACQSELRKEGQVVHLLGYQPRPELAVRTDDSLAHGLDAITKSVDTSVELEDTDGLLKTDQRQAWWKAYGRATGKPNLGLPSELDKNRRMVEVTEQPLLNYLVALSYDRGRIDFRQESSLNVVYEDLLNAVYDRGWAHTQHQALKGISRWEFGRLLEEIGLAAWHGDGRTATAEKVRELVERRGFNQVLDAYEKGAEGGVTQLLTAFYFRQADEHAGERTFEFSHKSFGEYLTALRVAREVKRIHDRLVARENDPDDGWDVQEALCHWLEVCGPAQIDDYILEFFADEVCLRDEAEVAHWQSTLGQLLEYVIERWLPVERLSIRKTAKDELRLIVNGCEAIVALHHACARVTKKVTQLKLKSELSLGSWLRLVVPQRNKVKNTLVLDTFGWIACEGQMLDVQDFCELQAPFAAFPSSSFRFACLIGANLQHVNLQGADLQGANLQGANLQGANLRYANLRYANLQGANLRGADLQGANLQGANLKKARMLATDLQGTIYNECDLDGIHFVGG